MADDDGEEVARQFKRLLRFFSRPGSEPACPKCGSVRRVMIHQDRDGLSPGYVWTNPQGPTISKMRFMQSVIIRCYTCALEEFYSRDVIEEWLQDHPEGENDSRDV